MTAPSSSSSSSSSSTSRTMWSSSSLLHLRPLLMAVLLLGSLATVLAWWEQQSNETTNSTNESSSILQDNAAATASIPFPGYDWLTKMASSSGTTTFTYNGTTYASAYHAMLYDNPSAYACRNFNCWLNAIFFSPITAAWFVTTTNSIDIAHYLLCYIRNLIGGIVVYYGTAGIFSYFCYCTAQSAVYFENRQRPSLDIMWNQIQLAQASLFIYTMLPVLDEYLVEQNYTNVYYTVNEIGGWHWYILTHVVYFTLVEIGIYWMHRTLHTNKFLYKHVHAKHHQYKTPATLTPWASIAFHPLDGMLQASPYVVVMVCGVPCHYVTHVGMLFFTAIWATYIHDSMDWNIWPIMGSKYHTIHHTHYIYNYGQVFVFCDLIWGTYREPDGPTGQVGKYTNGSTTSTGSTTDKTTNKNKTS